MLPMVYLRRTSLRLNMYCNHQCKSAHLKVGVLSPCLNIRLHIHSLNTYLWRNFTFSLCTQAWGLLFFKFKNQSGPWMNTLDSMKKARVFKTVVTLMTAESKCNSSQAKINVTNVLSQIKDTLRNIKIYLWTVSDLQRWEVMVNKESQSTHRDDQEFYSECVMVPIICCLEFQVNQIHSSISTSNIDNLKNTEHRQTQIRWIR